jgi:peptidoglycan hydrolase CwlO-like protein
VYAQDRSPLHGALQRGERELDRRVGLLAWLRAALRAYLSAPATSSGRAGISMPVLSPRYSRLRLAAAIAVIGAALAAASAVASSLEGRIAAKRAHERALRAAIGADAHRIAGFEGTIADLNQRLAAIQRSLDIQRGLLHKLQGELRARRAELVRLELTYSHDKSVLAAQLVAQYESPPPDVVSVVLNAHGFTDLLERLDYMKLIAQRNASTTARVGGERRAVGSQVARLAELEANQLRVTTAVLSQHDQVTRLRLAVLAREIQFSRARSRKSAELNSLRSSRRALERRLASIQGREARARNRSFALTAPGPGGDSGGTFAGHGGDYGFFPAPGTNYSVGEEPTLAARLDRLGKALSLHLIGISGYRSPQHSVEVGGFANDPHTRGAASDTPGIEGVPEGTLERFGLTRPFPGPAEADHIQLLGG